METLIGGVALLLVVAGILYGTRKQPGKRYDKKPPGRADADIDSWGNSG